MHYCEPSQLVVYNTGAAAEYWAGSFQDDPQHAVKKSRTHLERSAGCWTLAIVGGAEFSGFQTP